MTVRGLPLRGLPLRWVHLLLGGALLMPYFLLSGVVLRLAAAGGLDFTSVRWQFAAYALSLPLAALTGLFPLVRPLSVYAARALCGVPPDRLTATAPASWAARHRTAGWFVLHTGLGALVSGVTLAIPPAVVVLAVWPFSARARATDWAWSDLLASRAPLWLAPVLGLVLLAALVALAAAAGVLLARLAPALLGPTPADRLAAAERRAAELASRNRLARELHDSVGHALSAVTLQAGAARKVLDRDPEFARGALAAIEETARDAVAELDSVLGLLRDGEPAAAAPAPTLEALDALLARTRAAGVTVDVTVPEELDRVPALVSREAYRIVQEGLSNALRHAGPVPVRLRITAGEEELAISVENELPGRPPRHDGAGGRGLAGIAERARLLGGGADFGPDEGRWRVTARLPLRGGR